jgi:hypothetical protein
MFEFEVNPGMLNVVVAIALSLIFEYVPKVKDWYDYQPDQVKKQIMLASLVLTSTLIFVGQCAGWFATNLTCDVRSAFQLVYMIGIAIGVNQGFHSLTKRTKYARRRFDGR